MKTIKGPAIFLAQFMSDGAPFDKLETACSKMAEFGYKAVQIPSWDKRCMDLSLAAESNDYASELKGSVVASGMEITELSAHLQGQLVAVHPAYDALFDGFAPEEWHGRPAGRQAWAASQIELAIKASARLGLKSLAAFSGSLLWPYIYPWPQRPAGLVETGFAELARRWLPLLNLADAHDVDICFELHPGEDLHDGVSFERFLDAVNQHPRAKILYDPSHMVLQGMDYAGFIEIYHSRIGMFHVKDAEFRPDARAGMYGSYSSWTERPGRFRSLGDGQIDFKRIFTLLSRYDFDGWAVVEWECAFKDSMQGAREGADFVRRHIIEVSSRPFDDFAGRDSAGQDERNRTLLGI